LATTARVLDSGQAVRLFVELAEYDLVTAGAQGTGQFHVLLENDEGGGKPLEL
jgi:hypothetical protein